MNKFLRIAFGLSGDRVTVPDAAAGDGSVSFMEGYGPDYQLPATDPDSKNIEREKMNEILFDITTAIQELQSQGVPDFITTALNGGSAYSYAINAVVRWTDNLIYQSKVAANVALPTDPTKWALFPIITNLVVPGNTTLGDTQADTVNMGAGDFIKDAAGLFGFGMTPATYKVSLAGDLATYKATGERGGLQMFAYSSTNAFDAPRINTFRSRGTAGAPSGVLTGDELFSLQASARTVAGGSAYGGGIFLLATGTVTGANVPTRMLFQTSPAGSAVDQLEITSAGLVDLKAGSGALRLNGHITRFESAPQACPTGSANTVVAHGGSRIPDAFTVVLRCVIADLNYAIGDEIDFGGFSTQPSRNQSSYANATNIGFLYVTAGGAPSIIDRVTLTYATVTAANWRLVYRASWQ